MQLRSGVDVVEITRFERLNPAIKPRFLQRVFTQQELDSCRDSAASLAGRFAVKEAVAKALHTGIGPVSWQDIEIFEGPAGEPLLALHGEAARLADGLGLHQWSISISHTNTIAIAVAVAMGESDLPDATDGIKMR
ncbi:holo-[acyl-carrier-protein] synthase [Longilinea arvoryzae]|uniref:Holo-[acyl-carrier-protein] synthase n=1 Tax=Longilinea arvoryzae TaxID=360412 RepID=A0A0S7BIH9_9CHLR|nr:holo-ACP synthase [Longilinea arvoryzae]GAP15417.1 holo-[acyl-carrier-protein] synthase [Longilinea arvoryzae]